LVRLPYVRQLVGVDVDEELVDWCRNHLGGTYEFIRPTPPMRFAPGRFDVVYAGSVFTHLDEFFQLEWLREIHRTLRPDGGLLIASTHSPGLTYRRRDLSPGQLQKLQTDGFLFAAGAGRFNEDTAFHSQEYLIREWGKLFGLRRHESFGLNGYQDLHVWQKW
jgi:SAM-dependent methyltransferase